MEKSKMLCPECFNIFENKDEKAAIRNKNNLRIYFCCVYCKEKYIFRKNKMKKLGLKDEN